MHGVRHLHGRDGAADEERSRATEVFEKIFTDHSVDAVHGDGPKQKARSHRQRLGCWGLWQGEDKYGNGSERRAHCGESVRLQLRIATRARGFYTGARQNQ